MSRRLLLLGAGLGVVATAGGGVLVGSRVQRSTPAPQAIPSPPLPLVQALAAEELLIRNIDGSVAQNSRFGPILAPVRADHAAHARALRALIAQHLPKAGHPTPAPASPTVAGTSTTPTAPVVLSLPQLHRAEQAAAAGAAARATRLTGREAVLLASISASEASHAELLA